MEPFGLFNFLKTLLSDAPTQSEVSPTKNADSVQSPQPSNQASVQSLTQPTNVVMEEKDVDSMESGMDLESENAYVQFLQAHEARIKRLK